MDVCVCVHSCPSAAIERIDSQGHVWLALFLEIIIPQSQKMRDSNARCSSYSLKKVGEKL